MPEWTPSQQRVIGSEANTVICSAAAGSGKTAVMIERIARLIREGADPFSFLVITFTNAAAAEMKEKIRERLLSERNNPAVAAAAEKAGAMEICTIHAFCQHLIRQEFQIAGVDPSFQICTGAQREKLFADAFRRACNELWEKEDADYRAFILQYEPKAALEIVRAVWNFIMSMPKPFSWLWDSVGSVPLKMDPDHPWFRVVSRMIRELILELNGILRQMADMFDEYEKQEAYRNSFREDRALVDALGRWKDGEAVDPQVFANGFVKLPSVRNLNDREIDWRDRYQGLRKKLKAGFGKALSWMNPDGERMGKEFAGIRDSLRGLARITQETHLAYEQNKARDCVLDFTDLEHKALRILEDEDARTSVRGRWQRIFVDECQDVSSVQDALIQALAGGENTLFMVGDVKQSIYRFRLANPKLFLSRITGCGPEAGEVIFLQENFRSRPEVLETANLIFRDVMRQEAAELDYTPSDELKAGLVNDTGHVPVSVDLLELPEDRTRLEAVADHTAQRIQELTGGGPFDYRDIVILMPEVAADGQKMADLLKERGVPVFFDGKGGFFEQPEVEVFRNLLMMLDNPHLDLPLLTVLVNPPFTFTEEELSLIRLKDTGRNVPFWQAFDAAAEEESGLGKKCRQAKKRIDAWRFMARRTRLPDFCWFLLEDAELSAIFGAKEHGLAAQKNLRGFCLQADAAAGRGVCTLREFLEFLSEQASGGEMQAASALGNEDNLVRIMTIHKSKGLQFPVVFCLGLDKGLKGKAEGAVRMDEELGLCLRYKVPEWRLSRETAADEIFAWKKAHDVKAEKICLLYVAVTRAQEKLFLVGTETDRALWHMPPGDHRVFAASDFQDLIMPALLDDEKKSTTFAQGTKPYEIKVFDDIQQKSVENRKFIHNLEEWVETLLSAPPVDDLWMTDPEKELEKTEDGNLKKYSVTTVVRKARRLILPEEDEQTPEEKRTPEYVERAMKRYQAGPGPAFGEQAKEKGGAARGTVIHRFLSLVNLEEIRRAGGADRERLAALRDSLAERQVFTEEEASWIRPEAVERFFASDIGKRMLASPEVHREWEFNLAVRERGMMVQGMIDCAFREGDGWILLDYKTDRVEDETAFAEEYRPQLDWYALALEKLTERPVKEKWLYALSIDKAIRVE